MTLLEEIQERLIHLPLEKQREVLDYVTFLQRDAISPRKLTKTRSLRKHTTFGAWKNRKINALAYEQTLHAEWHRE